MYSALQIFLARVCHWGEHRNAPPWQKSCTFLVFHLLRHLQVSSASVCFQKDSKGRRCTWTIVQFKILQFAKPRHSRFSTAYIRFPRTTITQWLGQLVAVQTSPTFWTTIPIKNYAMKTHIWWFSASDCNTFHIVHTKHNSFWCLSLWLSGIVWQSHNWTKLSWARILVKSCVCEEASFLIDENAWWILLTAEALRVLPHIQLPWTQQKILCWDFHITGLSLVKCPVGETFTNTCIYTTRESAWWSVWQPQQRPQRGASCQSRS